MASFNFPAPDRQLFIRNFLHAIRGIGLHDALRQAVRDIPAQTLRDELMRFAPTSGLLALHGTGVRDEEVFATPSLLRAAPGVLTYYRLLLGVSQKVFYGQSSGLARFKTMEDSQTIRKDADRLLEPFCTELNLAMERLLSFLPTKTLGVDISQLPLMTLGAQADGAWRGKIGQKATAGIFSTLKTIIEKYAQTGLTESPTAVIVTNTAGRRITIALASDPDIVIREDVHGQDVYKVAIEIKGGTDRSNLHNRVGEAEKSHAKARAAGAQDCWTVIDLKDADINRLKQESSSTRQWFDLTEVLNKTGSSYDRLITLMRSATGI